MRGHRSLAALLMIGAATPALASGYGLREHSVDSMGMAYAGAAASDNDASYMAYNPAALAGVENADVSVGVNFIFPHSDGSYEPSLTSFGNSAGGDTHPSEYVNDAMVPSVALRYRVNDRWAVGVSVNVPWGLKTEYPSDWAGRYYAMKTRLTVATITPMVSYEVTPTFTIAAGAMAQYAKGTLSNAIDFGLIGALNGFGTTPGTLDGIAEIKNADDWSWGWVAGVMFHPNDRFSLGLSYRSSVEHTMEGGIHFTYDVGGVAAGVNGATGMFADTHIAVDVTTPDVVAAGLRYQVSDRWTVLAGADWTNWSKFKELRVRFANPVQPDDVTTSNWDDSWFVSAGLEYAVNESWTLRAGTAYDDTPVPDSTRSPRIPDEPRFWLAAGATWHVSNVLDVKVAYAHLFLDDAPINQTPADPANQVRGTLIGSSDVDADVVGASFAWRW